MIALTDHAQGTVVPVRAQPGARKNAIVGEHGGSLKVAVSAAPERGKANAAIAEVLAHALGCRVSQVSLLSGETSREKRFLVLEMSSEALRARIDGLLRPPLKTEIDQASSPGRSSRPRR